MVYDTRLHITLSIEKGESLEQATGDLPDFCSETFVRCGDFWKGHFMVSCSDAPELAEGDFIDDLVPYLRELLLLKSIYGAQYEMQIAIGNPAKDSFKLDAHSVAWLASLGAPILFKTNLHNNSCHTTTYKAQ